jgi:hypothetical protein
MVIAICCELSFVIRKLAMLFAPLGEMVVDMGMKVNAVAVVAIRIKKMAAIIGLRQECL